MDEGQLNEERRLMYVGITRAKHRLWLSHSSQSRRWGQMQSLQPSRFLNELPAADLQRDGDDPEREAVQRRERGRAHLDRKSTRLNYSPLMRISYDVFCLHK